MRPKKLGAYPTYLILGGASAFFSTIMFTLNQLYQLQVAHLNPLQLVLVGTVLETTVFLTQVPTGALADVYSRRLAVIVGIFLIGAGFILEGAIPRFETILLAQVIWGVGATFTDGADSAWITDEIGEEQVGHAFLRASQLGQVLSLVAIPISVALGSVRLNVPILVGAGLYVLLGVFLIAFMPEQGFKPTPREDRASGGGRWQALAETTRSGVRLIRRRPILLTFLGITLLYGAFSEGFDRLWIAHLVDNFSFPALGHFQPVVWFGIISAGSMLLCIGAIEVVRRRVDMNRHRQVAWALFAFTALLSASVMLFALAGSFFLALAAYWIASVFRRIRVPVFNTWLTQNIDPSVRATVLSIDGQTDALGQIAGGPALGAVATYGSLRAALALAGAILLPALLLFVRAGRQGRASAPAAGEPVAAVEL
ncbi:MAG TPA: MFS transporter [Ktedonobacterales bacterium]|nr:MFS transporter [Ktedonobacterales bacterium]